MIDDELILQQIKRYRQDLAIAEDLLREGKFDKLNELLECDLFHFCRTIKEVVVAEEKARTAAAQQATVSAIQSKYEAMMAMQGLQAEYEKKQQQMYSNGKLKAK